MELRTSAPNPDGDQSGMEPTEASRRGCPAWKFTSTSREISTQHTFFQRIHDVTLIRFDVIMTLLLRRMCTGLKAISSILPFHLLPRTANSANAINHFFSLNIKTATSTRVCLLNECVPRWRPPGKFAHLPEFVFWLHSRIKFVRACNSLANINHKLIGICQPWPIYRVYYTWRPTLNQVGDSWVLYC